jgi:hypothetical protein
LGAAVSMAAVVGAAVLEAAAPMAAEGLPAASTGN